MNELSDRQVDERLAELERDLGPTLRAGFSRSHMRAGFAAELRTQVNTQVSFARNLNLSEDKVRAAITQVEGPGLFYFGFGR